MASGGTPGEHGGTREMPLDDVHSVDPATRAYIHILRGLGISPTDIAADLDLDPKTPRRCLEETCERIADGEDPIDVWEDVTAPLYENDPESGGAN